MSAAAFLQLDRGLVDPGGRLPSDDAMLLVAEKGSEREVEELAHLILDLKDDIIKRVKLLVPVRHIPEAKKQCVELVRGYNQLKIAFGALLEIHSRGAKRWDQAIPSFLKGIFAPMFTSKKDKVD